MVAMLLFNAMLFLQGPVCLLTTPSSRAPLTTCAALSSTRRTMLRTNLDAVGLVVDIKDTLLNLVVDLPGCVDKCLLHVSGSLC